MSRHAEVVHVKNCASVLHSDLYFGTWMGLARFTLQTFVSVVTVGADGNKSAELEAVAVKIVMPWAPRHH